MTGQSASFDDFESLGAQVYELACTHAAAQDCQIGAVLGGLIYHAAIEALFDVPEDILLQVILAAGVTFRGSELAAFQGSATPHAVHVGGGK